MRKFFVVAAFVFGILLMQMTRADAESIYVGTYSNGTDGYFLTETFELLKKNFYACAVQVMDGNTLKGYLYYFIKPASFGWQYAHKRDAAPMQWKLTDSDPIASKCKWYCIQMASYGYVLVK